MKWFTISVILFATGCGHANAFCFSGASCPWQFDSEADPMTDVVMNMASAVADDGKTFAAFSCEAADRFGFMITSPDQSTNYLPGSLAALYRIDNAEPVGFRVTAKDSTDGKTTYWTRHNPERSDLLRMLAGIRAAKDRVVIKIDTVGTYVFSAAFSTDVVESLRDACHLTLPDGR